MPNGVQRVATATNRPFEIAREDLLAAFEDQDVFDRLLEEEILNDVLEAPEAREELCRESQEKIAVYLDGELLADLDRRIREQVFASRGQAIREALRARLELVSKTRKRERQEEAAEARAHHEADAEDEISALYAELAELTSKFDETDPDTELEARIDATWVRLRHLQEQEAQRFHEAFEASLAMPLDAGARILHKADDLRRELEDLISANTAPEDPRSSSS